MKILCFWRAKRISCLSCMNDSVYLGTLSIGRNMKVWLDYSFNGFDSVVSVHASNNVFSCLSKSTQVKLETSWAMITPLMGYVLCADNLQKLWMCARQRNYNDGLTDCC